MDLRRLRPAEGLLTVGAVALVVALFLPWYSLPSGERNNAWEALSVVDVILLLCAAVALLAVVVQVTQRSPALPVISSVAATFAAFLALVLVVIKVADVPGRYTDRCYGVWIALVAAVILLGGGWWAMRDERPGVGMGRSHLESSG
jgi:amino acid transporter